MSFDQLEMFEQFFVYDGEDAIVCKKCHIAQPPENFQHMESGEIKRKCRSCQKKHNQVVARLRKEVPEPPEDYQCPVCLKRLVSMGRQSYRNGCWIIATIQIRSEVGFVLIAILD